MHATPNRHAARDKTEARMPERIKVFARSQDVNKGGLACVVEPNEREREEARHFALDLVASGREQHTKERLLEEPSCNRVAPGHVAIENTNFTHVTARQRHGGPVQSTLGGATGLVALCREEVSEIDLAAARDLSVVGGREHGDAIRVRLCIDPGKDTSEGGVDMPKDRERLGRAEELVVI
jgi:hypothetical protein